MRDDRTSASARAGAGARQAPLAALGWAVYGQYGVYPNIVGGRIWQVGVSLCTALRMWATRRRSMAKLTALRAAALENGGTVVLNAMYVVASWTYGCASAE